MGLAAACATVETRGDRSYEGSRTYSGSRTSAERLGAGLINLNLAMIAIGLFDLPFSFLADTALLPVTIREENARQAEVAERMQTARDVATGVRSEAGASPVETARRLFESCRALLENFDPALANCYAVDAHVVLESGDPSASVRELSGREYKERVRAALARVRSRGDFVTYREVTYLAEGPNVRVSALRSDSAFPIPSAVTFLLGPGADGEWRILEERGSDWR